MPRSSRTGIRGLFRDGEGRWQIDIRWREPGTGEYRRYRELLPEGLKAAEAKERARKQLAAALAGGFNPRQEAARRLAAALDEYIKWRKANGRAAVEKQQKSAERLVASLGDAELAAVSPFAVERFKRDRQAAGAGPATVNRDLAVLRHFYSLAAKWGWVPKAHAIAIHEVPPLKEPPGRVRYLAPEEEGRLMAAVAKNTPMRRVILAALLTGMRQGELLTLRREAVDLAASEITLVRTKNNRVRRIPIAEALAPVLKEAMEASRTGYVFESRLGEPYTENGLRSAWAGIRERAKLQDFHFHDLRHSCATALRRRGAGLDVIQRILGHSSLAMVMRYAHVGEDLVRDAISSLPAPVARPLPAAPGLSLVK
jgi:integrase